MVRTWRTVPGAWVAFAAAALVLAGCAGSPCGDPCADPCDPCAPMVAAAGATPPADLPAANPGEAWCRVWVPAEYASVAETVCVKPATKRCVPIPARYGTRPKLVCVEPANMCEQIQPAVYGTKTRQVMVCPEREEIKKICCPPSEDLGPCEVQAGCYTKVVHPPRYAEEECPVCVSPERRCMKYQPARYMVVPERYEVEPARVQEICEPAQFETRVRQVMVRPGRWEWKRNDSCTLPVASPCATPGSPMTVPMSVAPMAAPQPGAFSVTLQDMAEGGEDAGAFAVGDTVRYDVVVESPGGSKGLRVEFDLPSELEFVEGNGGVGFEGAGQSASTQSFDVPAGETKTLSLYAKVVSAPESNQVEMEAVVKDAAGNAVVQVKERTQLKP